MPTICTLAKMPIVPNRSLSADGALRTLSWEVVCPSVGATIGVAVAGSGVGEGCGVCVGGKVAVMMTGGVGVGVSGIVTSALQAVLSSSTNVKIECSIGCLCFTSLLYPRSDKRTVR